MSDWINNFNKSVKQLNKEQRLAVETIEGTVMVLAGPGTGKTQIVATRIAYILKTTHMDPTNILTLTFTEAGVTALRERLIGIMGSPAYKVTIATFHGFSNEVIGIFPHLFTHTQTLRQIIDAERFLLIEEILNDDSNIKFLRPLRKPDLYVQEISQKIKIVKQEAISPEKLTELIDDEDSKQKDKFYEFVGIYKKYNEELITRGWYDYEDTIRFIVDALKDNNEVKAYFQERYQYILVDEYQDTNNSQNQLVEALADFYSNPNLFVVGDDKQAIYRFQGASVANMLYFKKRYPEMSVINLKINYRSSPEILNVADQLIANNKNQISTLLKNTNIKLKATRKNSVKPALYVASNYLGEYEKIISLIKNYQKDGTPLPSIAVIWRRRKDVKDFANYALKNNIEVSGQVIRQFLEEPSTKALIKTLKAVNRPENNVFIIAALKQVLKNKDLVELYKINKTSRKTTILAEKLLKSSSSIRKEILKILDAHKFANTSTIQELIEWIIVNTNHVNSIFRSKNLIGVELLLAFYDLAKNFSKQDNNNLSDFITYLDMVEERNLDISIIKLLPDKGLYIGTVHSVKGLEFDRIIIAGVDEKKWTLRKKSELIKLPSTIIDLKNWREDKEEEERRLFYVAVTRARESVDLTFSTKSVDGNNVVLPSQFIEELGNISKTVVKNTKTQVIASVKKNLSPISNKILSKQELEFTRFVIKTSPFSYSDMRAYTICPKQYYFSRVLRLPQPEGEALMYGNVAHGALEGLFREFRSYKSLPTKKRFKELIKEAADKYVSPKMRKKILEHSLDILINYYVKKSKDWSIPVGIEYSFTHHQVRLDNIWLTGKFDRIDVLEGSSRTVRVVDYKTKGRPISRSEIEGNIKSSDGEIKKQLVFYALLAKHDTSFPYKIRDFMISVIDDKKTFIDEIIHITPEEIRDLEKKLVEIKKEILNLKSFNHTRLSFDKGCELCKLYS